MTTMHYCEQLECSNFVADGDCCPQHTHQKLLPITTLTFDSQQFGFEVELLPKVFVVWDRTASSDGETELDLEECMMTFRGTAGYLQDVKRMVALREVVRTLEGRSVASPDPEDDYFARYVPAPTHHGVWEIKEGRVGVTDRTHYEANSYHYLIWTPIDRVIELLNGCADAIREYIDGYDSPNNRS